MRRHDFFIAVWVALGLGGSSVPGHATEPFRYPEAKYGKSELKYINGLPVLELAGTPAEIGEAMGVLAVRPALRMADYPRDLLDHFHVGLAWHPFVLAGRRMVERFPADYRTELEAMVEASEVPRDKVVAGNTFFDLKKFLACSALVVEGARSATGAPLLGRNLDYPSLGYAHEYSLVSVYRSSLARHAFASVGFPGLVGCLSGMNDAGLALVVLEVFQVKIDKQRFDASGTPYAVCYRRLLEECATVDEARAKLLAMKRTTTTNLVLADRHRVAVFEVSPEYVTVREAQEGNCICTNHFCTEDLKPFVQINLFKTTDRFQALQAATADQRKLGLTEIQAGLHAANLKNNTMQTMVFEPAKLRLHLAIGKLPASAGKMQSLDVGKLFARP